MITDSEDPSAARVFRPSPRSSLNPKRRPFIFQSDGLGTVARLSETRVIGSFCKKSVLPVGRCETSAGLPHDDGFTVADVCGNDDDYRFVSYHRVRFYFLRFKMRFTRGFRSTKRSAVSLFRKTRTYRHLLRLRGRLRRPHQYFVRSVCLKC